MDREKVIKTLTDALTAKENYPWARAEMSFDFIEALLELLKEQEAVEPHHKCQGETYSLITEHHVKFCPWCGRKIKWDNV